MAREVKYLYGRLYSIDPTLYKNNHYINIRQPYEVASAQAKSLGFDLSRDDYNKYTSLGHTALEVPYSHNSTNTTLQNITPNTTLDKRSYLADDKLYQKYLKDVALLESQQGPLHITGNEQTPNIFMYNGRPVSKELYDKYTKADAKSRAFNNLLDLVGFGTLATPALLMGGAAVAPLLGAAAPGTAAGTFIGNFAGDMAAYEALNLASSALTGNTIGEHIRNGINYATGFNGFNNNSILGQSGNFLYEMGTEAPSFSIGSSILKKSPKYLVNGAKKMVETIEKPFNSAVDFYKSGRLRGMYDASKYGLYDRVLGLNIYRKMPSAQGIHSYDPYSETLNPGLLKFSAAKEKVQLGKATSAETRLAESSPTGIEVDKLNVTPAVIDKSTRSKTFFGPYSYLNTNIGLDSRIPWSARSWRLGFSSASKGDALPKSLVEASRGAIQKAPSGSFIGADAQFLTIPLSIEKVGIKRTMLNGYNDPYFDAFGEESVGTKISPDAYRWFTLEGLKPGNSVVYAGKSPGFNNASIRPKLVGKLNPETDEIEFHTVNLDKAHNYHIKDLEELYKAGEITAKLYVDAFNDWAKEFGGRPAHVDWRTGEPYIYHPIIYKKQRGGSLYKGGNKPHRSYTPSNSIKKQIAEWEGDSMRTNRSFDAEAKDFSQYLPEDAFDKLTQKLLDGLFSYSYNVGSSAFNARVVPVLTKYLNGKATAELVQQSMLAAGDKKYRGLRNRRAAERAMFGGSGLYTAPTTSNSVEKLKLAPKVPQEFTNFNNVAPADATMVAPLYTDNKITYFK